MAERNADTPLEPAPAMRAGMAAPDLLALGRRETRRWFADRPGDPCALVDRPVHVLRSHSVAALPTLEVGTLVTFACGIVYAVERVEYALAGDRYFVVEHATFLTWEGVDA